MVASFQEYWAYRYAVPAQYLKDVQPHLASGDYSPFEAEEPKARALKAIAERASDYDHVRRVFVDTAFRVTGPVAFYADSPGKPREDEEAGQGQPVPGTYRGLLEIGEAARREVVLQTPYLILTERAFEGEFEL